MASRRVVLDILARTAGAEAGINRLERRIAGFGRAVRGVGGLLGGLAGGAGMVAVISKAINLGDSLDRAATKAGISGRAMSELAHAANLADVGLDGLSTGLKQMQRFASEAASGTKAATDTLKALGLTARDLRGIAADRQMEILAEQISKLKDPADRTRAAMEVFGRAGADLLPLFEQGAAGIRKAREEAQRLGISMSDENIKKLAAADDAIKRMTSSFDALAATLISKVAPGFTRFFNDLDGVTTREIEIRDEIRVIQGQLQAKPGWLGVGLSDEQRANLEAEIKMLERQLSALDAYERGRAARAGGAGRRGRRGRGRRADPLGFAEDTSLPDRFHPHDPLELAAEDRIGAIRVAELEAKRAEQFFEGIEEDAAASLEHINEEMDRSTKHWLSGVEIFRDGTKRAFEDMIETGKFNFRDFTKFLIAELAKKQIFDAIDSIADRRRGAFSGKKSAGGGGGFFNFFGKLLGFADGGSFRVGGTGGPDSQVVAFKATPDENVTVSKRGQRGGGVTVNQTNNFFAGSDEELRRALPHILKEHGKAIADLAVARVDRAVRNGRM